MQPKNKNTTTEKHRNTVDGEKNEKTKVENKEKQEKKQEYIRRKTKEKKGQIKK